jgi:hypothetical protein
VVFDFIRFDKPVDCGEASAGSVESKPQFVYKMIETLLPTACYQPEKAAEGVGQEKPGQAERPGQLLEL